MYEFFDKQNQLDIKFLPNYFLHLFIIYALTFHRTLILDKEKTILKETK